ncbi:DMT family transporter [soil metagenome]
MQSLWMLAAALLFSMMAAFAKLASGLHSAWEIMAWRNVIGLLVLLPIVARASGGLGSLATVHWRGHLMRNVTGIASMALWFIGLAHLPLAVSSTLYYTSSIFIGAMLFARALWSTRGRGWAGEVPMVLALAAGFAGILLVLRPTIDNDALPWALLGLLGGFMASIALLSIQTLGRLGEPSSVIVFYFTVCGLVAGLAGIAVDGAQRPDLVSLLELLGVGITAIVAQLCLTRAYAYGHVWLATNLTYTGIVFASLWGFLIWDDRMPPSGWLGIALIIASGVAATWLVARIRTPGELVGEVP